MKCPVEFFEAFPYPGEVSPEDRATLGSDPGTGRTSGEEGEAERFLLPIFDLFSGPQSDKPRGSGAGPQA